MKILFTPLNSPGFLFPLVGISLELSKLNHESTILTKDSHVSNIQSKKITTKNIKGFHFDTSLWLDPIAISSQVHHISKAIQEDNPDVIVTNYISLGAFVASELYKVPLVVIGGAAYLWPSSDQEENSFIGQRYRSTIKSIMVSRGIYGLTKEINPSYLLGERHLLQTIEGTLRERYLPKNVLQVGPCMWSPLEKESKDIYEWIRKLSNARTKIVYIQLGKIFNGISFWDKVIKDFKGKDTLVVVDIGRSDRPIKRDSIPNNFFISSFASAESILPYCDLVITNGNTTVTLAALKNGVYCVINPVGGEQFDVAKLFKGTELGIVIEDIYSINLNNLLYKVTLDSKVKKTLESSKSLYSKSNGLYNSAKLIEDYILNYNYCL